MKKQVLFGLSVTMISCVEDKKIEEKEETGEIEDVFDNPLFYLAQNGITVMCPEAEIGNSGIVNGVVYTKRDQSELTGQRLETSALNC